MAETQGPPSSLIARVGGSETDYADIGAAHRAFIESMLPDDWTWQDKRVLDFGCGVGRTLQTFRDEAESGGDFWGSDIHAPSIAWANEHLSPPFSFFTNEEMPPLDQPDRSFDFIYAMSVFTHIADGWAEWIAELNRVLKPGGYAVVTFLGEGMWTPLTGRPWDPDKIGMISTLPGTSWEVGGPNVFHSEWWLREHWGRAFEIAEIRPFFAPELRRGHGFALLRADGRSVTPDELRRIDPDDRREVASLQLNVDVLSEEGVTLRSRLDPSLHRTQASGGGGGVVVADDPEALRLERDQLARDLDTVLGSRSWRAMAPLRWVGRRLRSS